MFRPDQVKVQAKQPAQVTPRVVDHLYFPFAATIVS
jgi:hypothetical protein